jgi:hypothetical protein
LASIVFSSRNPVANVDLRNKFHIVFVAWNLSLAVKLSWAKD